MFTIYLQGIFKKVYLHNEENIDIIKNNLKTII